MNHFNDAHMFSHTCVVLSTKQIIIHKSKIFHLKKRADLKMMNSWTISLFAICKGSVFEMVHAYGLDKKAPYTILNSILTRNTA
jgi:hypothetical protein